jgi:hypothetical protein
MVGACVRGELTEDGRAPAAMHRRYGVDPDALGASLSLDVDRVTWWRGFQVSTTARRRRLAAS